VIELLLEIDFMNALHISTLFLICVFAGRNLSLTYKKQKQDLWKLRWEFYEELRNIYCRNGLFDKLYRLSCMNISVDIDFSKMSSEDAQIEIQRKHRVIYNRIVSTNGTLQKTRKEFPGFVANNEINPDPNSQGPFLIAERFQIIYEKGYFLFSDDIENFLISLFPETKWKSTTKKNGFTVSIGTHKFGEQIHKKMTEKKIWSSNIFRETFDHYLKLR